MMLQTDFLDLFLSTEMIGYLGPLAMITLGYFAARKDKGLGVIWYMVECLMTAQYLALLDATPDYWWQIFILIFGGLFTLLIPLMDR